MKIGDLVKINESGHYKWGADCTNPANTVGKVTEIDGRWIYVDWSNGQHNSYQEGDLTLFVAEQPKVAEPKPTTGEAVGKSAELVKAKMIYVVYEGDEFVYATPDREDARGLKADLGGKRDGIKILAYSLAKEIR